MTLGRVMSPNAAKRQPIWALHVGQYEQSISSRCERVHNNQGH